MKGKPPKEILERRAEGRTKKKKPDKRPPGWDWKYWFAIALAVAGLILGALGLQARPTVSLDAPLDPANVITTPFIISNDGILALGDIRVQPYIKRIVTLNGGDIGDYGGSEYIPPTGVLEAGERKTVPFAVLWQSTPDKILAADIALIVSFRPAYLPFWKKQRAFRFTTGRQVDGNVRLFPQPAGDILNDFIKLENKFTPGLPKSR